MQKDFEKLLHNAEDDYLRRLDIIMFQEHVDSMVRRLETYRYLRDHEVPIFQAIANQLENKFLNISPAQLQQCLLHWISVMRYGAMGMLLNNPEYFQYRLLEWLGGMVQVQELMAVETKIANLLNQEIKSRLPSEQFKLLRPFLNQAEKVIFGDTPESEMAQKQQVMIPGEQA